MIEFAIDSISRSYSEKMKAATMKDNLVRVLLLGGIDSGRSQFKESARPWRAEWPQDGIHRLQQGKTLLLWEAGSVCAQRLQTFSMCSYNLNKADVVFVFVTDDDAPIVNNIWHMLQTDRFQVTVAIKLLLD